MHQNCSVCEKIDPDLNNYENAELIGTSESSIRRHKSATGTPGGRHSAGDPAPDLFDIPAHAITQRRRTIKMEDGSWERITYRPQDLARQSLWDSLEADITAAVQGWKPSQTAPTSRWGGLPRVLHMSDLQVGKAREAGGGTEELLARVTESVNAVLAKLQTEPTDLLVLADNGDIIENFDNVGNQAQTNDLNLTEQVRMARRIVRDILLTLLDYVPNIIYVSVPSNHCQVRAKGSKDLASVPEDDWGIEVNYQLQEAFALNDELAKRVKFLRPAPGEEAVTLTLPDGTHVGFVHGHQASSADKVGEWWKGQSHGRRSNLHNADILTHGHWHTMKLGQSGDERWLIGCPSSDGGSGWFTNKTGERSTAGMLTYTVSGGRWWDIDIV